MALKRIFVKKPSHKTTETIFTSGVSSLQGCGTGRLLRKITERWPMARLIGVDTAASMIEKARQLMPYATFYISKAESLPLHDDSVDLAFSTASFHHWQDKEKALREIKRVLRSNGRFLLADTWPPFGLSRIIRHFQSNNSARIGEAFADAGLHVKDQRKRLRLWLLITVGERL